MGSRLLYIKDNPMLPLKHYLAKNLSLNFFKGGIKMPPFFLFIIRVIEGKQASPKEVI